MQFYKITNPGVDTPPTYTCTLKEAHDTMRTAPSYTLKEVYVDLIEIATDKATLASVLSGWGATEKTLRTWKLTPRLGLKEAANGE